ncbi:MAG: hypothetical protein P1V20_08025 [Verrucomicrobiales bacterium]|nr:hypothetical protein [Verrucomicrobiales bacterium]
MIDIRLLESSLRAFHENDPLKCETVCRKILSEQIDHPLGGHLLAWSKMERKLPLTQIIEKLRTCPETKKARGIPARATLGWLLWNSGRTREAIVALTENLQREPERQDLQTLLGICLLSDNQHAAAAQILRCVVSQSPKNPVPRFHLAHAYLHLGQWQEGWAEWEKCRFDLPVHQAGPYDTLADKLWNGEDLSGKVIVIEGEQGFGDQIQFIRFAHCLRSKFDPAEIHFSCHPAISDLMQWTRILDSASGQILTEFDYYIPVMSLPHRCGARIGGNLYSDRYLFPQHRAVQKWQSLLPRKVNKLRIGICWRSAPMNESGSRKVEGVNFIKNQKSLKPGDLKLFLDSLQDRADIVSLQKDPSPEEISLLDSKNVYQPDIANFTDTAAIIELCDRIITIDTATAHLAGALGSDTRVLLPRGGDWRWTHAKDGASIWYPHTKLHRQTTDHIWDDPIDSAVKSALAS